MKRLPMLVERAIHESRLTRLRLADAYERSLRASTGGVVTCQKGCAHCCHYPVLLTVLEGLILYRHLAKNHLWGHDLQQAFKDHAKKTWTQSAPVWMLSEIPCPLLKDKHCIIYKSRPFMCRITTSTGDPFNCHPHRFNEQTQLLPRRPWMEQLEEADRKILRQFKLSLVYLPLSTATLYGERIHKGEIVLGEVDLELLGEFVRGMS